MGYPRKAYEYVKQAVEEAGTTETWAVFQKLDSIMRRRYAMSNFSAPLWERELGICFISDLEKLIREVTRDGAVAADKVSEG
jgi:hypothetical protein